MQVTPPAPAEQAAPAPSTTLDPYWAVLWYFVALVGIVFLGLALLSLRVRLKKAKAGKVKAMGSGLVVPLLLWMLGGFAMIVIGNLSNAAFVPFLVYAGTGVLGTFAQVKFRKRLKQHIAEYHLPCPNCHKPMNLVDEMDDDAFLSVEEVAEEKAEGMDYEFWRCEPCDRLERLEVKIGKAKKCPKCTHLTLVTSTVVLHAATKTSKGRERIQQVCKNPKCNYHHEYERTTPKLSSSSGRSSGGSSFSSGSFGGGSSGGGGASRGW